MPFTVPGGTGSITVPPSFSQNDQNIFGNLFAGSGSSTIVAGSGSTTLTVTGGDGGILFGVIPTVGNTERITFTSGDGAAASLPPQAALVVKNFTDVPKAVNLSTATAIVDTISNTFSDVLGSSLTQINASPALKAQYTTFLSALADISDFVSVAVFTGGDGKIDFRVFTPTVSGTSNSISTLLDNSGPSSGVDSLVGANEILLSATGSTSADVFAVNLSATNGVTVVLQDVDAAVLGAKGVVRVEGNTPIRITSDNQAQNVTGGGGNDTLVGTGNDTLTGGTGSDVFGFNATGKYTITDFNKAADTLAFKFDGVTTLDQLKAKITSVVTNSAGTTYNFGPDTSITLVGVSATDLTAGMIKFTIS